MNPESHEVTPKRAVETSFTELTTALAEPIPLIVEIGGVERMLSLKRLTAAERASIDQRYAEGERRSAFEVPPMARGEDGDPRPNEHDTEYKKRLVVQRHHARAMVVMIAWPSAKAAFQATRKEGEASTVEAVTEFVESQLTETVIESIYLRCLSDGLNISLGDRVSFTSAGG